MIVAGDAAERCNCDAKDTEERFSFVDVLGPLGAQTTEPFLSNKSNRSHWDRPRYSWEVVASSGFGCGCCCNGRGRGRGIDARPARSVVVLRPGCDGGILGASARSVFFAMFGSTFKFHSSSALLWTATHADDIQSRPQLFEQVTMSGSCGMGAVVTWQDGAVVITSINPLGPAAATGEVLVGDHIMSVGAVAVSSVEQARALILGPSEQPPAIAHMAACSSVHYTNCFACFLFTAFPLFL